MKRTFETAETASKAIQTISRFWCAKLPLSGVVVQSQRQMVIVDPLDREEKFLPQAGFRVFCQTEAFWSFSFLGEKVRVSYHVLYGLSCGELSKCTVVGLVTNSESLGSSTGYKRHHNPTRYPQTQHQVL